MKVRRMLQTVQFRLQGVPLHFVQPQSLQFLHLMAQVVNVSGGCPKEGFQGLKCSVGLAPFGEGGFIRRLDVVVATRQVKDMRKGRPLKDFSQIVLSVNAHQLVAQLTELSDGGLRIVDEHARTTVSQDFPTNGNGHGVGQVCLGQPFRHLGGDKFTLDHGTVAMQSHAARVGAVSEEQAHGPKQDALSGTGFSSEDMKACVKRQLDLVDQGVVLNPDAAQHQPRRSSYDWMFPGSSCLRMGSKRAFSASGAGPNTLMISSLFAKKKTCTL